MLKYCVDQWEKNKENLRQVFEVSDISSDYEDFARIVIENIFPEWENYKLNATYLGDYTGDVVFFINSDSGDYGSRHSIFLSCLGYGSCSVCDSLLAADESEERVHDLMMLALSFIQEMSHPYPDGWNKKYDIVAE